MAILLLVSISLGVSVVSASFSFDCAGGPYCPNENVIYTCKTRQPFLEYLVKCPLTQTELDFHAGNDIGYEEKGLVGSVLFTAQLLVNSTSGFVANLTYNTRDIPNNTTIGCTDGFTAESNECEIRLIPPPSKVTHLRFENISGILSWESSVPTAQYNVTVTPPPSTGACSSGICTTNDTWINITKLTASDVVRTVAVEAINCAGKSDLSVYRINHCGPETADVLPVTLSTTLEYHSTVTPSPTVEAGRYLTPSIIAGSVVGSFALIVTIMNVIGIFMCCFKYRYDRMKGKYNTDGKTERKTDKTDDLKPDKMMAI